MATSTNENGYDKDELVDEQIKNKEDYTISNTQKNYQKVYPT